MAVSGTKDAPSRKNDPNKMAARVAFDPTVPSEKPRACARRKSERAARRLARVQEALAIPIYDLVYRGRHVVVDGAI